MERFFDFGFRLERDGHLCIRQRAMYLYNDLASRWRSSRCTQDEIERSRIIIFTLSRSIEGYRRMFLSLS